MREKDGLWTVLLWLNVIAVLGAPADQIVRDHWRRFGRHYYARHDYEGLEQEAANSLMQRLRDRLTLIPDERFGDLTVERCDDFSFTDPVDGSVLSRQGIRIFFCEGARAVIRLSGTGTSGATLRLYLERFETDPQAHGHSTSQVLSPVARAADEIAEIATRTGLRKPTIIA